MYKNEAFKRILTKLIQFLILPANPLYRPKCTVLELSTHNITRMNTRSTPTATCGRAFSIINTLHMTCRIWLASKAVPGSRITGLETCPASTHTMLGYSSSPKSDISLA